MCLGIGEADWAFKASFEASDWELSAPNVDLVFDGLDTFSVISLVRNTLIGTGSPEPRDARSSCERTEPFPSQNGQKIIEC